MQFTIEVADEFVDLVADSFARVAPMPDKVEVTTNEETGEETRTVIPFTLEEKLANARGTVIAYIQAVVRQHQQMTAQEEAAAAITAEPIPIQ